MKVPKVLAMYLPQFHKVKENDEWWGEDFTDWSTVKAAKPLYPGHEQPKRPVEYYDLMQKDVMCRQAEYMHKYGVDGMCFYHYYFEDGRKILEKPAENLLRWTDIDMPFCFYWANESWVTSWSNIRGNVWAETFEKSGQDYKKSILLQQNYGGREEWERHFEYLLPFFKDSRYLKHEGHPMFIILNADEIECLREMQDCWNEGMEKEGMPSIYFVGFRNEKKVLDTTLIHEPTIAFDELYNRKFQNEFGFKMYISYDEMWEKILNRQYDHRKVCLGGFTGYDDTPRQGYSGRVVYGATPEKFKKYLIRLLLKAGKLENEFVFLNAWNEWGEGMYLEPDEKAGNQYLEAVKAAREFVYEYGDVIKASWSDNLVFQESHGYVEKIEVLSGQVERYKDYWIVLSRWFSVNSQGKSICQYFIKNSYDRIAVYGLGLLGVPFVEEMRRNNIQIMYGIDQDGSKKKRFDFPVYKLQDQLPDVDTIVITVGYAFNTIKKQIGENIKCRVISLSELLDYAEQG